MASLNLLCFKLHKIQNPFRLSRRVNPFLQPAFPVNWTLIDSKELSLTLNNQVRNNHMELEALRFSCEDKESEHPFSVQTINNEIDFKYYPISP